MNATIVALKCQQLAPLHLGTWWGRNLTPWTHCEVTFKSVDVIFNEEQHDHNLHRVRMWGFLEGYLEAALWSSIAYGHPNEEARGESYDASFEDEGMSFYDVEPELLARMIAHVESFWSENLPLLRQSTRRPDHLGHDLWLAETGAGCDFEDREGTPDDVGKALNKAARVCREPFHLVWWDGKVTS